MNKIAMFFISIELKWIRHLSFAVIFTLLSISAAGQIQQSGRYETPLLDNEKDYYKVVSVQEQGIILYRTLFYVAGNQIEIIRVDTTMQEVWRGFVQANVNEIVLFTYLKQEVLYLLIKNRYNVRGDFAVVALNIVSGSYISYTVRNLIPFNPTEFTATNGAALVGGYFNYRPIILHYSFKLQQSKILPGFFNEPGELTQLKPNEDGSVDIIVSAKNLEKRKSLWIRNYDAEGNLVKTTILEPEEKKNLIFARSLKMPNGDQVISGVYGRYSEYSRGIFIASVNVLGEYSIKYYQFADLEHFFNYMKARREKRVKEKIERRRVKGKKIKFNYRVLVQELLPIGDQYILLGEAFYPHYTYPGNVQVFDGYQYTHAVVIGFDQNRKLIWDNSFEINDVKTYTLEKFVKIAVEKDRIILLYLYENTIRSKIISGSEVLEGKSVDEMKLKFEGDEVKERETESSKLDHWYGSNFIAYGVQRVNNKKNPQVASTRKVFFINKITHDKTTP